MSLREQPGIDDLRSNLKNIQRCYKKRKTMHVASVDMLSVITSSFTSFAATQLQITVHKLCSGTLCDREFEKKNLYLFVFS